MELWNYYLLIMSQNSSYLLIVNPVSGRKSGKKNAQLIIDYFKKHDILLTVFFTAHKGHAKQYIYNLNASLFSHLIIYGGDGTFNEVINGLLSRLDNYQPVIGLLPGGSGNSVMYHLKKLHLYEACNMIINKKVQAIDVMQIRYKKTIEYSINMVGWGMVTDIGILSESLRWLGLMRYNIASLFHIMIRKDRYAKLIIDGTEYSANYLFVLIANTKYTGKGMIVAPNARLNDNLLDLIIVKNNIKKIQLMKLLPQLFTGKHIYSKYVDYKQVSTLQIISNREEPLNIDGEIYGSSPVEIQISEKKLFICSD